MNKVVFLTSGQSNARSHIAYGTWNDRAARSTVSLRAESHCHCIAPRVMSLKAEILPFNMKKVVPMSSCEAEQITEQFEVFKA